MRIQVQGIRRRDFKNKRAGSMTRSMYPNAGLQTMSLSHRSKGSGRFDPRQFNGSISLSGSQQYDDQSSIRGVKVYFMKHDRVNGGVQIEEAESEADILDQYQPSDGFSDPMAAN